MSAALLGGPEPAPLLSGVVIHWHAEDDLARLAAAWPADFRFELIVVDNGSGGSAGSAGSAGSTGSAAPLVVPGARVLAARRNLGFAGGANAGIAAARAPIVLLLNPDARPEPGALEALLEGFAVYPEAAGLAPRLRGEDGGGQHSWQLRPLPTTAQLLLQAFLLPTVRGPRAEPPPGAVIAQPAAAALALRKSALAAIADRDGAAFDAAFFPAWFEDVDLARRLADAGSSLRYWPAASFRHRRGGSVQVLGYAGFLDAYYRNLHRYLRKHSGAAAAMALRMLLPLGAFARLLLLPVRRPQRARSRSEAAKGLHALAWSAALGFPERNAELGS